MARFSGWLLTLAAAGLGLWLAFLAVPRTIVAFIALPGDVIGERVREGREIGAQELLILQQTRRQALPWGSSGRQLSELALALLLEAERLEPADPRRHEAVSEAVALLERSLTRSPARPFAWTRLAYACRLADCEPSRIEAALRMAFRTAPINARLTVPRIELGLLLWPELSEQLRSDIKAQIDFAWRRRSLREQLIEAALRAKRIATLRVALLPEMERLMQLERYLERRPRKDITE